MIYVILALKAAAIAGGIYLGILLAPILITVAFAIVSLFVVAVLIALAWFASLFA